MAIRGRMGVGAAALTIAAVVAIPGGVASASPTVLNSGQWADPYGRQPVVADYAVTTTGPYWSVAFTRPGYIQQTNYKLAPSYLLHVLDGTGTPIAASGMLYDGSVNFVAIDGNIRAAQAYTARMNKIQDDAASEQYGLTFINGDTVAPVGTSTIVPPASGQPNNAYVRDVWVPSGQIVSISVGGVGVTCPDAYGTLYLQAYLLGSDPAKPATAVQGLQDAVITKGQTVYQNGANCEVRLTAVTSRAAWYGLVIMDPGYFKNMYVTVAEQPIPIITLKGAHSNKPAPPPAKPTVPVRP
jgi:hypothetical protein